MTMRLNDISYLSQFDFLQTKEEKKKKGKKKQRLSKKSELKRLKYTTCEHVRYLRSWISQCYEVDECAKITQVTGRLFASILSGGPRLPQFQSIDSDLKRTLRHAFRKIRFLADPDSNFDIVQVCD
ncbi:hypothetical protein APICC_02663 [Apis cerana cerana]|uniref:Uncharacterized protein n=1 Tax=Apis cerana cerana TaxID=94128 RepID=A0A2A3EIE6_APICC|nr:hypothetical protein APICC_02663 [Apis cerana cerana]